MNLTGRPIYQKGQKPAKVKAVRDAARDNSCKLRIPGVCKGDPATTVGNHMRFFGLAGAAQKPDDVFILDACDRCHAVLDSRDKLTELSEMSPRDLWVAYTESQLAGTIATASGQPVAACYDISFTGQQHPRPDTARFITELVNAYRSGQLVPVDALATQRKRIDELEQMFVTEREDVLWNAYNVGHERDGKWHHCCMSDGEWLVRECGLEPIDGQNYDAEAVKDAIPKAARAALASTTEGEG